MRLGLRDMLAHFIKLGTGGVRFSFGGCSETFGAYNCINECPADKSRTFILTVLLDILRCLDVGKPLGLGKVGETLGARFNYAINGNGNGRQFAQHLEPLRSKEDWVDYM